MNKDKIASLKTFDVQEHLQTPEDRAAYIQAALEESMNDQDLTFFKRALKDVAQAEGMAQVARTAGVQRESLYSSLAEKGNPTLKTLMGVLAALDLRLEIKPNS